MTQHRTTLRFNYPRKSMERLLKAESKPTRWQRLINYLKRWVNEH